MCNRKTSEGCKIITHELYLELASRYTAETWTLSGNIQRQVTKWNQWEA